MQIAALQQFPCQSTLRILTETEYRLCKLLTAAIDDEYVLPRCIPVNVPGITAVVIMAHNHHVYPFGFLNQAHPLLI